MYHLINETYILFEKNFGVCLFNDVYVNGEAFYMPAFCYGKKLSCIVHLYEFSVEEKIFDTINSGK